MPMLGYSKRPHIGVPAWLLSSHEQLDDFEAFPSRFPTDTIRTNTSPVQSSGTRHCSSRPPIHVLGWHAYSKRLLDKAVAVLGQFLVRTMHSPLITLCCPSDSRCSPPCSGCSLRIHDCSNGVVGNSIRSVKPGARLHTLFLLTTTCSP